MAAAPFLPVENSPSFVAFAKCFCINPVYAVGRYRKRTGWVLIDLATTGETSFKTLRDARQHLLLLYAKAAAAPAA
jgi:hypothetical protein